MKIIENRIIHDLCLVGKANIVNSFMNKYSNELELCEIETEKNNNGYVKTRIITTNLDVSNKFRDVDKVQRFSVEYPDTEFSMYDETYKKFIDDNGELSEEGMDQFISFVNGDRTYYSVHA